ncbi:MAG: hypothetical protein ACLF0G_08395 [Candidatus Brocadiia bacterium]
MDVCAIVTIPDAQRAALAAYVLRTFLSTLGLPHEVVREPPAGLEGRLAIWYGSPAPEDHGGPMVEIACLEPPAPDSPVHWLLDERRGHKVAVVGKALAVEGDPLYCDAYTGQAIVAREGARVRVGADVVGSAGLWLTAADERGCPRDAFGRVPGAATPRAQAGLVRTPVVNDLVGLLWEAVRDAAFAAGHPLVRLAPWPDGHRFAVLLSHDVDQWRKRTLRQLAKELGRSWSRPLALARTFLGGRDPWSDLEAVADLEEARGMRSTFFLLAGRPDHQVEGVHVVNSYGEDRQAVAEAARRLATRGCEVALHASYGPSRSAGDLAAERDELAQLTGQPIEGCRQHFVHFHVPATWEAQAEAAFRYDASLGYHDLDGYRAGFSFPFRPWAAGRQLPLLELPLVVMDGALQAQQGLDAEAAGLCVEEHLRRAEADGAMVSLLWHNTYFCQLDAPGYRGVYEQALDWTREHGGWGAGAGEIAAWWTRRAAASLEVARHGAATRVGLEPIGEWAELPLEVHSPARPELSFERCQGRVVEEDEGCVRCLVGDVVAGRSALLVRGAGEEVGASRD